MSLNRPNTMPSFTTDRSQEDIYYRQHDGDGIGDPSPSRATSSYSYPYARSAANGHAKTASTSTSQIKEKIGDLLAGNTGKELPLYKDKPQFASNQYGFINRVLLRRGRKRYIVLFVGLVAVWWFSSAVISWFSVKNVQWDTRRDLVRHAFKTSWEDYAKYAWGKDEYNPISHRSKFMVNHRDGTSTNSGAGWIIVDGLDTAIMMGLTSQVAQARKWIQTSLDFSKLDGEISTFETTIRVFGGLLSAHYLSTTFPHLAAQRDDDRGQKGEDLYIEKATDLADRLLGAFDTPSGIPLASVNLNTSTGIQSIDPNGASSTAEATTLQLELKYLSKLTGEPLYWTAAEKVMEAVDAPRREGGLLPIYVNPQTGAFQGENIRLGSRGDSYYEYLIKQYLQTGELIYKEMWEEALEGIKRHMITWSKNANLTILAEREGGLKGMWSGKMDHLTCFLPGTIALAVTGGLTVTEAKKKLGSDWGHKQEEDLILAEELMKTCWGMYAVTPTGLAPEIAYLNFDDPPRRWNFEGNRWKQPRSAVNFRDFKSGAYTDKKASWREDYDIHGMDEHNLQRPETVESLYYMWRITEDEIYREWGWRIFRAFQRFSKVVDIKGVVTGYTSLDSVMKVPPRHLDNHAAGMNLAGHAANQGLHVGRDNMEGFWLAETLKYLYLLFCDDIKDDWFDLSKVVINTEAHFFPRFDIKDQNVFTTGWTRKERQS